MEQDKPVLKDLKFMPEQIDREAREFASIILGIPPDDINEDDTIITGFKAGCEFAKAPEMYEALKQAKEALSRVSNCNDLATAREYSREALETINKLGI